MKVEAPVFYLFSASHSFLLGLLPIYIPVLLWNKGLTLEHISFFIVLSSIGFSLAFSFWVKMRASSQWLKIILLSFITELLLIAVVLSSCGLVLLALGGFLNDVAFCFYLSTQRILLHFMTQDKNTGNTLRNLHIVTAIVLKIGLITGGYLLAKNQFLVVFGLSVLVSFVSYYLLFKNIYQKDYLSDIHQPPAITIKKTLQFKDNFKSKLIFSLDGIFLFLESYFWVIFIFMLLKENILKLSLVIVLLSISLAFIFWFIKKKIDHVNHDKLYFYAVGGYILSWVLRGYLNSNSIDNTVLFYIKLLLITFLSNFFRLAYNKRFFYIARLDNPIRYIACRAYYGQFGAFLFFILIGILASLGNDPINQLQIVFYLATPLSFTYFLYRKMKKTPEGG